MQFTEQKSISAREHGWFLPNCAGRLSKVGGLAGRKWLPQLYGNAVQTVPCCARKSPLALTFHKVSHLCWDRNAVNQNTSYNYQWFSYTRTEFISLYGDISYMVTNTPRSFWASHLLVNKEQSNTDSLSFLFLVNAEDEKLLTNQQQKEDKYLVKIF